MLPSGGISGTRASVGLALRAPEFGAFSVVFSKGWRSALPLFLGDPKLLLLLLLLLSGDPAGELPEAAAFSELASSMRRVTNSR